MTYLLSANLFRKTTVANYTDNFGGVVCDYNASRSVHVDEQMIHGRGVSFSSASYLSTVALFFYHSVWNGNANEYHAKIAQRCR